MSILDVLRSPWPWYVAGPLIGLIVPVLLLIDNKSFGISANLRHVCAAVAPRNVDFFRYDWRASGSWNLVFALGIVIGGFVGGVLLASPDPVVISQATRADLMELGIRNFDGLVPRQLFSWHALTTLPGLLILVGGGLLIGFGTAYAGGCTSGHAIMGLADFQLPSLIAVIGFFTGGLVMTHVLLPVILRSLLR